MLRKPVMSPDASPNSPAQGAAPGPSDASQGSGRDRIQQLVAQREDAKKARDQAVSAIQGLQSKYDEKDTELQTLKQQVAGLLAERSTAQPKSPWADWKSMPDADVIAMATSGATDPVTGQKLPPDPQLFARGLSEYLERRSAQIAKELVVKEVGGLKSELTAQDRARSGMADAVRQIRAIYHDDGINDATSPLNQTATKLVQPFAEEFGKEYVQTPVGLRHLFAEAARLVASDSVRTNAADLAKYKAREASAKARKWGSGGPPAPPTDQMKAALAATDKTAKQRVRDAIRASKFYQTTVGDISAE